MRSNSLAPAALAFVVFVMGVAASPAFAAVTVYTNQASFLAAAPSATLLVDFESRSGLQPNPFSDNGLTFSSPNQLYVITPTNPGTTSPLPPSHMLSASGAEDFTITMPAAIALGFTLLTNAYTPHHVTLYDANNASLLSYVPTQAPNTVGFVGFTSSTPIARMRWQSANGAVQNTALDNFRLLPLSVPATTTTWGRVKAIYR